MQRAARLGLLRRHTRTAVLIAACASSAVFAIGCHNKKGGPKKETVVPVPQQSFVRAWTYNAQLSGKHNDLEKLYLTDNNLFAYTSNNEVYILTRSGGSLQSVDAVNATGGILREPVTLQDRIVFPTGTTLEVFDTHGILQRSMPLPYPTRSLGNGLGDTVYIGLDYPQYGRLTAIDISRQYSVTRWELQTRGAISSRPAVFDKVIFVGSEDGNVYAVDIDRNPIWPLEGNVYRTGGRIVADLKADEYGVYVASTDSKLYCIERNTGKTKWQYFASAQLNKSPIVTADSVYQAIPGEGVVAIDKTAGKFNRDVRWSVKDADQFLSQDEKYVYLKKKDKRIIAVDKATGEQKFQSKGRDFTLFATNPTDSMIYAAKTDGTIVAIKPVLTPGTVGELVRLDETPIESLAMAR